MALLGEGEREREQQLLESLPISPVLLQLGMRVLKGIAGGFQAREYRLCPSHKVV